MNPLRPKRSDAAPGRELTQSQTADRSPLTNRFAAAPCPRLLDEWEQAPGHAVVEVVDEASLANRGQIWISQRSRAKTSRWDSCGTSWSRWWLAASCVTWCWVSRTRMAESNVPRTHEDDAQVERLRSQSEPRGEVAGAERRQANARYPANSFNPSRALAAAAPRDRSS